VASTSTEPAAPASAGSIYDLGYRHYEGARLGRRHAIVVLYLESLRGAFGLGRSAAAKIAPAVLIFFALVPALIQMLIGALFPGETDLIRHDEYYEIVKFILGLYCAAVAPDIAGRDQRNRSLTLYFSRAIKRSDYALSKLAAMTTAMLLITLGPQLLRLSRTAWSRRTSARTSARSGTLFSQSSAQHSSDRRSSLRSVSSSPHRRRGARMRRSELSSRSSSRSPLRARSSLASTRPRRTTPSSPVRSTSSPA
jgi:hypothetical protein